MKLKFCSWVVFLIITILKCSVASSPTNEDQGLNWPSNSQDVRQNIVNYVLRAQGTSAAEIQSKIIQTGGNLEQALFEINFALKETLLQIDGDVVRINFVNAKNIVRRTIHDWSQRQFATNPFLGFVLENSINQEFSTQSEQFRELIESTRIPVNVVRKFFTLASLTRNKRDAEVQNFNFLQGITDVIFGIVRQQIDGLITNLLENVKNALLDFQTTTPPENDLESAIAYVKNIAIKNAVAFIAGIQQTLNNNKSDPLIRSKRELIEGNVPSENSNGLLDLILKPIINFLSVIAKPLNNGLKNIISNILSQVEPALGRIAVQNLKSVLFSLVDVAIPCLDCSAFEQTLS